MSKINTLQEVGLAFCDICDNYTPTVECADCQETECSICVEAYGCSY